MRETHSGVNGARAHLPTRRQQVTHSVSFGGQHWAVSIGLDPATGQPKEVFLNGPKAGSDAEAIAQDGAVMMSVLLQMGVSAVEIARRLGREGIDGTSPAASLLGFAALKAADLEQPPADGRH